MAVEVIWRGFTELGAGIELVYILVGIFFGL